MIHTDATFAHCDKLKLREGELTTVARTFTARIASRYHVVRSVRSVRRPMSVDAVSGTMSAHATNWSSLADTPPSDTDRPFSVARKGSAITNGRCQRIAATPRSAAAASRMIIDVGVIA